MSRFNEEYMQRWLHELRTTTAKQAPERLIAWMTKAENSEDWNVEADGWKYQTIADLSPQYVRETGPPEGSEVGYCCLGLHIEVNHDGDVWACSAPDEELLSFEAAEELGLIYGITTDEKEVARKLAATNQNPTTLLRADTRMRLLAWLNDALVPFPKIADFVVEQGWDEDPDLADPAFDAFVNSEVRDGNPSPYDHPDPQEG